MELNKSLYNSLIAPKPPPNIDSENFVISCGWITLDHAPVGAVFGLTMVFFWTICRLQMSGADHQVRTFR